MYVIRLPEKKFQAAKGPVDNASQANQFETLQAAFDAISDPDTAKGISEYDEELRPIRHLTVEDAETELTEATEETEEAPTDGV